MAACVFALLVGAGCKHQSRSGTTALPPLVASSWLVDLDVPGFGKAALAVPLTATEPRSIVIALHGAADRPEWACSAFRAIAGPRPFVLCPRGVLRRDFAAPDLRYTFGREEDTERELRAALVQLKQRFGAHVAPGPVVFTGFEIGADHAAWIARQEPLFFSRLLLAEPASSTWPPSQAALFGRSGGSRVLFASASERQAELQEKALLTRRAGADARVVASGVGALRLDAATRARLGIEWRWLAAPPRGPDVMQNTAGNPLSAEGPGNERPAP